jgi:hypothetical protein
MIARMAQSKDRAGKEKTPDDPPARRNRSEPVGRSAGFIGAAALARAGFRDPTLILRWDDIVGPDVARIARPLKISDGPSGGVLTLKAEPGAAVFLQYETRKLCERINNFLGREAVSKLKFVQGPLPPKPARKIAPRRSGSIPESDPALSYIGQEGLRSALINLARARNRGD